VAVELDVGAGEEVETGLVETALWGMELALRLGNVIGGILFGTANSNRSFRL
jgi:hypothetical protein